MVFSSELPMGQQIHILIILLDLLAHFYNIVPSIITTEVNTDLISCILVVDQCMSGNTGRYTVLMSVELSVVL